MITPSDKIYLAKSTIAGRGVFARVPIKKGELIEECPVVVVPYDEQDLIPPDFRRYVFGWNMPSQQTVVLVMGYGTFYNHSVSPNAYFQPTILRRVMNFIALRDIGQDEEIFTNYGYQIQSEDIREGVTE